MRRIVDGVYALQYAARTASVRGEHFYGNEPTCHEQFPIDYFVWAICRADDVVLVDAGFTSSAAQRRGNRTYLAEPAELLGMLGRSPAEVSELVLSHMHYDHTGHVAGFPHARIHLQRREHEFWNGPFADRGVHSHLHESSDVVTINRLVDAGQVVLHDGDVTVDAQVSLHLVGGHTPGMQVVRVATGDGPVVLAADASHFYENIEEDKPYGVVNDLPLMYAAFDRLVELAGDDGVVVPGHDPRVRDRHEVVAGTRDLVTLLRPPAARGG
jgi:glyoxylase-like metal-dependent hydrolase (beta-lactamase superfamily II)